MLQRFRSPLPWKKLRGFTLIELMVVTTILGILTVVAIPTVTLYLRRAKTAEARAQIAKMFDGASAYFNGEHVDRGDIESLGAGGIVASGSTHKCPYPEGSPAGGEAGVTPDLSVDCHGGPGGRCVPSASPPGQPGYYNISQWGDSAIWDSLSFGQEQGHFFRYNFQMSNALSGFGACQFTAQAFGDLDGDGGFSTFERAASADQHGLNAASGLYIDRVVE